MPRARRSVWRRIARDPAALVPLGVIVTIVLAAIVLPSAIVVRPQAQDLRARFAAPSTKYWLGTDSLGRDQTSRLIVGARVSLTIAVTAVTIAAVVGIALGLSAGYLGGMWDTLVMRGVDVIMAFPMVLLAIVLLTALDGRLPGLVNVAVALGLASVPGFARVVRGQVLVLRETDFVIAARAVGCSAHRVMRVHVLRNCATGIIVYSTLRFGGIILTEASLSFLGLGVPPPTATWGGMVAEGTRHLQRVPWLVIAPGLAIILTVLSANLLGDALRDAFDPRSARAER